MIALSPELELVVDATVGSEEFVFGPTGIETRLLEIFEGGTGAGLVRLGAREVGSVMPAQVGFWRELGRIFVARLHGAAQAAEQGGGLVEPLPIPELELAELAAGAPPMTGGEYLNVEALGALWQRMNESVPRVMGREGATVLAWLAKQHIAWQQLGRVHFHLAIDRKNHEFPFALLVTVASALSASAVAQHRPLGRALQECASRGDREGAAALLVPVAEAAKRSPWVQAQLDSRALFAPARLTAEQACAFLRDLDALQDCGVVVRLPAEWSGRRPARAVAEVAIGKGAPTSAMGLKSLLDFRVALAVDGDPLTGEECAQLLSSTEGLVFLRGRWVEVDAPKLKAALAHYETTLAQAHEQGVSFVEALRLLAGTPNDTLEGESEAGTEWAQVVAGPWLAHTLKTLRGPVALEDAPVPGLRASLRPYQRAGVAWMELLCRLGLGGCLADDMGLGKTIQVIALILRLKAVAEPQGPHLLVVPASLLANWRAELARFAPEVRAVILHASEQGRSPESVSELMATNIDVVITTYAMVLRQVWLKDVGWHLVVLDEAQAIKNPGTRQARAVKELRAAARLALTGTPVENRLGDLWSLFDFVNPGLLGSAKAFDRFAKRLAKSEPPNYGPLRLLVSPYILRRLKTDRRVIADLPDKVELKAWCGLSPLQAALYQKAVQEMAEMLPTLEGVQRRGAVLALLMKLKQICNHPSQWLGDNKFEESDSGKWSRLRELASAVRERQEKLLVFTQFRSVTGPLAAFLASVFGRAGLELHGGTAVKQRQQYADEFQRPGGPPFMVLSIKAGGTGLNLTAACHVVHFDRWWNPAVENQATDRAFRIGQTRNVLVHKLICRGTMEERIDEMLDNKSILAQEILEGGAELRLTELSDSELLNTLKLDLSRATMEDNADG